MKPMSSRYICDAANARPLLRKLSAPTLVKQGSGIPNIDMNLGELAGQSRAKLHVLILALELGLIREEIYELNEKLSIALLLE